jgi:hypothetical protein
VQHFLCQPADSLFLARLLLCSISRAILWHRFCCRAWCAGRERGQGMHFETYDCARKGSCGLVQAPPGTRCGGGEET